MKFVVLHLTFKAITQNSFKEKKKQTCTITPPALTLCTVWPFVTDGAHAVSISAGAVAAAKRVYALCDRDVAFGSFPAAVTHTGALVVLAVAAAQHRACRCRNRETERLNPAHKNKPNKQTKKKKTISKLFKRSPKRRKVHVAHPRRSTSHRAGGLNRVAKGLESANDMKSNYRQR